MARRWNLEELIEEVKFLYNFNSGQVDQDMRGPSTDVDKRFREAINEAYCDEVEEAAQMGDVTPFLVLKTLTWAGNSPTLDVGDELADSTLYRVEVRDTSAASTGAWQPLWLSYWTEDSNNYWLDRRTLQWGLTGPGSDKSVRFTYIAEPAEMLDDMDEPTLIPRRFRHLLAYAACLKLRFVADDQTIEPLRRRRDELRERLWKSMSQGRPAQTGYPGATTSTPDVYGFTP
jgi:hypothetical protein